MTSHCGLSYCSQKVGGHWWHGLNVSVLSKQAKYKGVYGFKTSCTPATVFWNIGCTFFFSENVISIILVLTGNPCLVYRAVKMENSFLQQSADLSLKIQEWKCTEKWWWWWWWWWRRRLVTHSLLIWARQIWREIWFLEMKGWTAQQQAAKSKFSKSVINIALHFAYIKRQ